MKVLIALLSGLVLISGCAREKNAEEIVAIVNEQNIYLKDLKKEISIQIKQNPGFKISEESLQRLLNVMIEKQLIIQEAMKMKMSDEEEFVNTIKSFWEQTLIRNFITTKNKEFEPYIFVTDEEISDYYKNLKKEEVNTPRLEQISDYLRDKIKQEKKAQALDYWLQNRQKMSKIQIRKKTLQQLIEK